MAQESVEGTFRAIVDALCGVMSSGATDAPTGHFAVVEIPEHDGERAKMAEVIFDGVNETFDSMETGWYFVIQRTPDNVTYDKCKNLHQALARFALARAAYEDWLDG